MALLLLINLPLIGDSHHLLLGFHELARAAPGTQTLDLPDDQFTIKTVTQGPPDGREASDKVWGRRVELPRCLQERPSPQASMWSPTRKLSEPPASGFCGGFIATGDISSTSSPSPLPGRLVARTEISNLLKVLQATTPPSSGGGPMVPHSHDNRHLQIGFFPQDIA